MPKKKSVQKPKNIKKTLLRIFGYMAKRRLLLILVILFVLSAPAPPWPAHIS